MPKSVSSLVAVLDANVLYPAPLRDLLMHLAVAGLFQARWSAQIHEEWIRNLLLYRLDLTLTQLERTRAAMNSAIPDSVVEGYEGLIAGLQLPDENDRHVLAAAIQSRADVIVTSNIKDFPLLQLAPYGILPKRPDEFIGELLSADEERVCLAIRRQRAALKNPPVTVESLLGTLEQQGLTSTVARLAQRKVDL